MKEIETMIKEFTQSRLSAKRFAHVERVVETIERIADAQDIDRSMARSAAWLHDSAKEEKKEAFRTLVESGEIDIDDETLASPKLWHGYHAAYWGKTKFRIEETALLDAVKYHPTGSPGLANCGQALFIADYCEPGRNLPGTEEIVRIATTDLKAAALQVVEEKVRYIRDKKGKEPHSRSIAYRRWLIDGKAN